MSHRPDKPLRWENGDLLLQVRVQPRASRDEIVGIQGSELKIRITASPVDGKGNDHLVRFLADTFQVPRSAVSLENGKTARSKRLRIRQPAALPDNFPVPVKA